MSAYMTWGDGLHLTRALFAQDRIWVTAKSEVKKIADMTPSHVLNTLLMLERMEDLPFRGDELHETPLYGALKERILAYLPPEDGSLNLGPVEHPADEWRKSILDGPLFQPIEGSMTIEFPNVRFTAPEAGPAEDTVKLREVTTRPAIIELLEAWLARDEAGVKTMSPVTIQYKDAEGNVTTRDVWPKKITTGRGRLGFSEKRILEAFDTLRDEPRHFRLDRITWAQAAV